MYYGLEACPVNKSQIKSLHFAVNDAHIVTCYGFLRKSNRLFLGPICHLFVEFSENGLEIFS